MGMNFGAYLVDTDKLKESISEKTPKDVSILDKALPLFGDMKDNRLVLLCCEYWQENNSYYGLMGFIDRYFNIDSGFELVSNSIIQQSEEGQSADEVADELGIELPEERE